VHLNPGELHRLPPHFSMKRPKEARRMSLKTKDFDLSSQAPSLHQSLRQLRKLAEQIDGKEVDLLFTMQRFTDRSESPLLSETELAECRTQFRERGFAYLYELVRGPLPQSVGQTDYAHGFVAFTFLPLHLLGVSVRLTNYLRAHRTGGVRWRNNL